MPEERDNCTWEHLTLMLAPFSDTVILHDGLFAGTERPHLPRSALPALDINRFALWMADCHGEPRFRSVRFDSEYRSLTINEGAYVSGHTVTHIADIDCVFWRRQQQLHAPSRAQVGQTDFAARVSLQLRPSDGMAQGSA